MTFEDAKQKLNTLSEDPGPSVKLQLYALFKQATVGKCNSPKPGMLDMVGKAKWTAWNDLKDMSQDEAKQKYVELVSELLKSEKESATSSPSSSANSSGFKQILYEEKNKITTITLNRPQKMNAITRDMYFELIEALNKAGESKSSMATVITGAGKYYSSGNDLANLAKPDPGLTMQQLAEKAAVMLEMFVNAFIDHPKVLIAKVNGPCIGIACTTLSVCDVVYASDAATFHTPFTSLGLTPEGCSSYTFPKLMGPMKANEMLLLGRKLTAADAARAGLVTEAFSADTFDKEVEARLESISKLMPKSLKDSKMFVRGLERDKLHEVNHKECQKLIEMWQGDECLSAATKFLSKK